MRWYHTIRVGLRTFAAFLVTASLLVGRNSATSAQFPSAFARCQSLQPGTFQFVSPKVGWTLVSCHSHPTVLRSTDGGRTWRKLTVPLKAGPIATVFLDSAHAWMAEAATQSQDAIIRTSNGGTTWHRTLLNVTLFRNYVPYFAALTFLNRQAGWLDTIDVHERIARLYRTGDGGAHWTPIAANLPISEILGFQTPALGYGADIEGGGGPGIVYRSKDGGRHWQPFHLSLPPIYRHVRISVMFDSVQTRRQGVILPAIIEPLDLGSHVSLAVYRSNDEGLHWIRGAALDLQSDTNDEITAFANLKDGWAITNRGFCRTVDAGATWRKINTNIILRTGDVIDFLNARLGFVLTTMDTHERLLRTKDAGRTWQVVARLSV